MLSCSTQKYILQQNYSKEELIVCIAIVGHMLQNCDALKKDFIT